MINAHLGFKFGSPSHFPIVISYFILFIFIGLLGVAPNANAKQKFGTDLGIGIKGGLNFNKVVASEWKNKFSTDPHAGFFVYINKYRVGIQAEANWTQTRMTTDSSFYGLYQQYYQTASDSFNAGSFRFSTVSIPLLLNIKLSQFLWLQLGPQYSASVNMVDKNKLLKSGVDIVKSGNFNAVGGLWVQLGGKAPLLRVNLGLRYISGISNMSNLNTITGAKNEWKNQMIQVHVGISY